MKKIILVCALGMLIGCSGTLTVDVSHDLKKPPECFFIIKQETSYRIPNRVIVTPGAVFGYDGPEYRVPAIGDTWLHIKNFLEKSGYIVSVGTREEIPSDVDAVIRYVDYWQWDFIMYLKLLAVTFTDPKSGAVLAYGNYECAEGGFHDYPSSEEEVPLMLKEIVAQFKSHGS